MDELSISVIGRRLGKDFLFTVTGGREHIGAVSTVYRSGNEWVRETFELPGHKGTPPRIKREDMTFTLKLKQSPQFYEKMWESIREKGTWQGEIWNRRKNGDVYPECLRSV